MHRNVSEYYENNWQAEKGLHMVDKLAYLGYRWIKDLPKGNCLDIGCGDGTNAKKLKKSGFAVYGLDISKSAVKKAKIKNIKTKVIDLNLQKLPYKDNFFDLIWMTDVIEHVFWPDFLLSEINRVIKKGGYLYLTTPNVSWYIIRLRLLLGETLKDIHPEHIHWFNKRQLLELVSRYEFKTIKFFSYLRFVPFPITQKISFLEKINFVGKPSTLFSYSFAILTKKT